MMSVLDYSKWDHITTESESESDADEEADPKEKQLPVFASLQNAPRDVRKIVYQAKALYTQSDAKLLSNKPEIKLPLNQPQHFDFKNICIARTGSDRQTLFVVVGKTRNYDDFRQIKIPIIQIRWRSAFLEWTARKWIWFAALLINKHHIENVFSILFSYKLEYPPTNDFYSRLQKASNAILGGRWISPDTGAVTDLALKFDRMKILEIEDRSQNPAYSYESGMIDIEDGDNLYDIMKKGTEERQIMYNTQTSVFDNDGKSFPTLKDYIHYRFEKTKIKELPHPASYMTEKYYKLLRIHKQGNGGGNICDLWDAERETKEKKPKRIRQFCKQFDEDVPEEFQHKCALCGVGDGEKMKGTRIFNQRCARCGEVWYCSRKHQKLHWKSTHRRECKKQS